MSLKDPAERSAAKSAMALCKLIEMHGWERGLAEFRGEAPTARNNVTLGEYLAEVTATGEIVPRTLRTYVTKVRKITADIGKVKLSGKLNKFDHVNGGAKEWQRLVDAVPLRKLTADAVLTWLSAYLAQFRSNPAKLISATKTANSCVRAGKAIHASLAIENNTLSLDQATAVIAGKRVPGLPRETQEVRISRRNEPSPRCWTPPPSPSDSPKAPCRAPFYMPC